jgi:hypothetical protein
MSKVINISNEGETITVHNLRSHGVAGFAFEVPGETPVLRAPMMHEYRTNESGEGLWKDNDQILGTGQFQVGNRAQMRRKLESILLG